MFPIEYLPLRFTCSAAIGHWSSGCHNKKYQTAQEQITNKTNKDKSKSNDY